MATLLIMKELNGILTTIRDVLSYKIYDSDTTHIAISTLLIIIVGLVAITYILKLVRRLVTAKLPEEDKNKFEGWGVENEPAKPEQSATHCNRR